MAATAPASDRPELQRIDGRLCVYTCVHASAGGVRAPVASRRHLDATKPDWGPEASPSARHTHAIEFIMSLGDGVRERGCHFQQRWWRRWIGAVQRMRPESVLCVCVECVYDWHLTARLTSRVTACHPTLFCQSRLIGRTKPYKSNPTPSVTKTASLWDATLRLNPILAWRRDFCSSFAFLVLYSVIHNVCLMCQYSFQVSQYTPLPCVATGRRKQNLLNFSNWTDTLWITPTLRQVTVVNRIVTINDVTVNIFFTCSIHLVFSIRACMAICSLKGRVFRFQLLPVILSVPKQAIMLFDFANWHLFIFFMYYCNYNHIAHSFVSPKSCTFTKSIAK